MFQSRPAGTGGNYWVGVLGLSVERGAWVNGHGVPPQSVSPRLHWAKLCVRLSKSVAMDLISSCVRPRCVKYTKPKCVRLLG